MFAAALREELQVRPAVAIEDRTVISLVAYRDKQQIEAVNPLTELSSVIRYIELVFGSFVDAALSSAGRLEFNHLGRSLLSLELDITKIKTAARGYEPADAALLVKWRDRLLVMTGDLHWVITLEENRWLEAEGTGRSRRLPSPLPSVVRLVRSPFPKTANGPRNTRKSVPWPIFNYLYL